MKRYLVLGLAAICLGIIGATLLVVFEFIGVNGTDWLWNEVLRTDTNRWLLVPVAVVFSLALTFAVRLFGQKRIEPPEPDLMSELRSPPSGLTAIGIVLAIGAVSLLAGGSIGPEAALMAASAGIGAYVAYRFRLNQDAQILVLASVGALLVAFVNSIILVLVPILLLIQQAQNPSEQSIFKRIKWRQTLGPIAICLIAGGVAYITLGIINNLSGESGGYGSLPIVAHVVWHDFLLALLLGFVVAGIAATLNRLIARLSKVTGWIESRRFPGSAWVGAALFGLVVGLVYLASDQSVQFSGSIGSKLLFQQAMTLGFIELLWLLVAKIFVTAWSKAAGYRGGLVFPSIYAGVAVGLIVEQLTGGQGGAGAMVGSIAGILTAVIGSPVMGGIFLVAVLPFSLLPVALCAIAGTIVYERFAKQLKFIVKR